MRFTRPDTYNEPADDYDPTKCRCPDCGRTYSGAQSSGGHCRGGYGGCCQSFSSQTIADQHFTFSRDGNNLTVGCLTPEQMQAKGWQCDDNAVWRGAPAEQPFWKGRNAKIVDPE